MIALTSWNLNTGWNKIRAVSFCGLILAYTCKDAEEVLLEARLVVPQPNKCLYSIVNMCLGYGCVRLSGYNMSINFHEVQILWVSLSMKMNLYSYIVLK